MTSNAEALIATIAGGRNDEAAHALLAEFFAGLPIVELRPLLLSENEETVKTAAWIASELGGNAQPLLPELEELLGHPSKYVRFFLLDAVLAAATDANGPLIAKAVGLISDPEVSVRWKTMNFLTRANPAQLVAACAPLAGTATADLVTWLVDLRKPSASALIAERLRADDRTTRLFAAVAAARIAADGSSALQNAAQSTDSEVSSFAQEQLRGAPTR